MIRVSDRRVPLDLVVHHLQPRAPRICIVCHTHLHYHFTHYIVSSHKLNCITSHCSALCCTTLPAMYCVSVTTRLVSCYSTLPPLRICGAIMLGDPSWRVHLFAFQWSSLNFKCTLVYGQVNPLYLEICSVMQLSLIWKWWCSISCNSAISLKLCNCTCMCNLIE